MNRRELLTAIPAAAFVSFAAAACGSTAASTTAEDNGDGGSTAETPDGGLRQVSATEGASIQDDPPADLVILDVRTIEEFSEGHLEGATMIDFYANDFADQLAELDPDVPYLLYCRSGNRSGQTIALMEDLGFSDVADIDGGIIAWNEAGLPTIPG